MPALTPAQLGHLQRGPQRQGPAPRPLSPPAQGYGPPPVMPQPQALPQPTPAMQNPPNQPGYEAWRSSQPKPEWWNPAHTWTGPDALAPADQHMVGFGSAPSSRGSSGLAGLMGVPAQGEPSSGAAGLFRPGWESIPRPAPVAAAPLSPEDQKRGLENMYRRDGERAAAQWAAMPPRGPNRPGTPARTGGFLSQAPQLGGAGGLRTPPRQPAGLQGLMTPRRSQVDPLRSEGIY